MPGKQNGGVGRALQGRICVSVFNECLPELLGASASGAFFGGDVMASAKYMRVAMQIRWLIDQTAGECTLPDMVELTGASRQFCMNVCHTKGWSSQYRKITKTDVYCQYSRPDRHVTYVDDRDLDYLAGLQDA